MPFHTRWRYAARVKRAAREKKRAPRKVFFSMTSEERKEARHRRRRAARERKRDERVSCHDRFENITCADNLAAAFKSARRGVSWKESVQRYEAGWLRNLAETRRALVEGKSVQKGFVEFTLRERGKIRRIKSVHIAERVVQKCLCDNALVPILSRPSSMTTARPSSKGLHFALNRAGGASFPLLSGA